MTERADDVKIKLQKLGWKIVESNYWAIVYQNKDGTGLYLLNGKQNNPDTSNNLRIRLFKHFAIQELKNSRTPIIHVCSPETPQCASIRGYVDYDNIKDNAIISVKIPNDNGNGHYPILLNYRGKTADIMNIKGYDPSWNVLVQKKSGSGIDTQYDVYQDIPKHTWSGRVKFETNLLGVFGVDLFRRDDEARKLPLGKNYSIEKVAMLQVENMGTPRLYYVVLSGPRGGRILCDPMNITDILAHKFNITHDLAGQSLVNYAMKTGKIDMIVCDYWTVHNDRTGLNAARTEDKHLSQRLIGRVYSASDQEDFRNKIFKQFYIEPNWMQI